MIRRLLSEAFEGDFSHADWEHTCGGIRFLGIEDDEVISHGAVITRRIWIDGNEHQVGYVEGIAVTPQHWRKGHGSKLMKELTSYCAESFSISLLSPGEKEFYSRFGWREFSGKSFVKEGDEIVRTREDDDSLMYLLGRVPISEPLQEFICEIRSGDPW